MYYVKFNVVKEGKNKTNVNINDGSLIQWRTEHLNLFHVGEIHTITATKCCAKKIENCKRKTKNSD